VGIDEAGRGPLAGSVVAAAVILPRTTWPEELNDSKKLSAHRRATLEVWIKQHALYGLGQADKSEIESINILQATFLAMRRAVDNLEQHFHKKATQTVTASSSVQVDLFETKQAPLQQISFSESVFLLVDGRDFPFSTFDGKSLIKGDTLSAAIAAASILAKTARDRQMIEAHETYPHWGFDKHKGYGTPAHQEAIRLHGLCALHRKSFCSGILEKQKKTESAS
jgi:ribonuclease HII